MPRRLSILLIIVAITNAPTSARIFDFPQKPDAPLPLHYVKDEIGKINRRLEDLQTKVKQTKEPHLQLAIRAAIRVREIAKQLLEFVGPNTDSSQAALYGLTLSHSADEFDDLFKKLPELSRKLDGEEDPKIEDLRRLDRFADALNRFVTAKPPTSNAANQKLNATEYTFRYLSPLLRVLRIAGEPSVVSTWLPPNGTQRTPAPTAERINALNQRLQTVKPLPNVRERAGEIADVLSVAARFADFQPRVSEGQDMLARLADFVETVENSSWIATELQRVLDFNIARELEAYKKVNKRSDAIKALNRTFKLTALLTRFQELQSAGVEVKPLQDLFLSAFSRAMQKTTATSGQELLDWLHDIAATMHRRRAIADTEPPPDIQRALVPLVGAYEQTEKAALARATKFVASPELVGDIETTKELLSLQAYVDGLEHLSMYDERINQFETFRPSSPDDLKLRLRNAAKKIVGTAEREQALHELNQFTNQLARMSDLPGEKKLSALADTDADDGTVLGVTISRLSQGIRRQKTRWANAWASGEKGDDAEKILLALEKVVPATLGALVLGRQEDAAVNLNRWVGWQSDATTTKDMIKALQGRMQSAAISIVSGRMDDVEVVMKKIETDLPFVMLVSLASQEIGDQLGDLSGGASGALSQIMYRPGPDAFLGEMQFELAVLVRCVNESGHTKIENDDAGQAALSEHGKWAIQTIQIHLERKAGQ